MSVKEKIVVFLPNWVGDVVMATPTLRALRRHFAQSRIAYVGRPASVQILAGTPWADELIIDLSGTKDGRLKGTIRLGMHMRRQKYDLAVIMPNSFRTALMARLGGARRRVGYDRDWRGWLLNEKLSPLRDEMGFVPVPALDYYAALGEAVGAYVADKRMELPVVAEDETAAETLFAQAGITGDKPTVMFNPGAAFGTSKLWNPGRFAAIADYLIGRYGAQVIVNAAPAERRIAERVGQLMKRSAALNFATRNNSIGLLKSMMKRCDLLITNDTGARHVGAAFGIGVVTIFGSTDPDWTTLHYPKERLVRVDVPCSPCQKKTCRQPAGPLYHQCMTAVTVEMVMSACDDLLGDVVDKAQTIASPQATERQP